MVIFKLTDMIH